MTVFVEEQIPFVAKAISHCCKVFNFKGRELVRNDLIEKNCKALFVRSTTKVNKGLLDGTSVEFVATATSGTDHVDTDYLRSKNIYFVDAKGSNANSVAEYVVFSILRWSKITNKSLNNLKIGIIGFGHIGKLVGKYANFLKLEVLVNDPPLLEEHGKPAFPDYTVYCELDEIIEQSDIITNHVPLTRLGKHPTYYLLNRANLLKCKDNVLFIHTSRGGVVQEEALESIFSDKNASLVVDVWENEPNFNCPLARKCLIATPHVAGYSFDAKIRGAIMVLNEFEKFAQIKVNYSEIFEEYQKYSPINPKIFENTNLLYEMLLNSRQILNDTSKFLELCEKSEQERIKGFDMLRKNYPIRRETL